MKKIIKSLLFVLLLCSALLTLVACKSELDNSLKPMESTASSAEMMHIIDPDSEVRGVWIASVYNIDFPSYSDKSAYELKNELDDIIKTCTETGINTIYFQVRPSCDALYESDIFPVSKWLSSTGNLVIDPLEYMVANCHLNNIRLYAWVNPLRVSVDTTDIDSLPEGSPAREHPEWVVEYSGRLYFNPGIPEVRTLVTDGVREIVKKYDVDGVVFDDYFYPYPSSGNDGKIISFDDKDTYKEYGSSFDNIADWRRDNINQIILSCYNAVHGADPECTFGVSPFGVWQNDNGSNGGSATRNLESYNDLYCDTLAWIEGGYVDFISPQIYWRFDSSTSPYDTVLRWWNTVLDGTDVKLIVSHAAYQYDENWTSPENEMNEQISYSRSEKSYYGSMMYGYDEIRRNVSGLKDELITLYKDEIVYTNIVSNDLGVTVSSPANGTVTSEKTTYLIGQCDPYYPLTMNGKKVSCTKSGYFNIYVTLDSGDNTFIFEQNGKTFEYTITYRKSSLSAAESDSVTGRYMAENGIEDIYPSNNIITSSDTLWVQCVAPYKSKVTVTLGGETFELVQTTDEGKGGDTISAATFGKTITLPKAEDGNICDAGKIVFYVTNEFGECSKEGAGVRILGTGALIAVRAINDYTNLKVSKSSSYYYDYTVQSEGMVDYITSLSGGYYELRMGGFVSEEDVEEITDILPGEKSLISSAYVRTTEKATEVIFMCEDNLPYNGYIDGNEFVLSLYNTYGGSSADIAMAENPIFSDVIRSETSNSTEYRFTLIDKYNFYGFDLHYDDKEIILSLKNPISINLSSDNPLGGIRIVLDAGHGGVETGALGFSSDLNEKDINLLIVLLARDKLAKLGAEVILTREDDSTVTLYDRMDFLEETEPDIMISIHQNSEVFTKDITGIRGTLGLYCMDSGLLLADTVGKSVADALGRWYQETRYQMLAVCRNPKFPAALIEVGYITSAEEYEEITSQRGLELASDAIVDGILSYYSSQAEYTK